MPRVFASLSGVSGLRHALTTRSDEGSTTDLAASLGCARVATLRQVHGARVVDVAEPPNEPPAADALVVAAPGLIGAIFGADCPLLLLVAPRARVLALVHSGWRGTAAGIVGATVGHLEACYGVRPDDLRVAVGPSICAAHYEVGDEVARAIAAALPDDTADLLRPARPGHALLDLGVALDRQLEAAGVLPSRIERHPACTWEAVDTFHSYRRDGEGAGRHALLAGWA